MNRYEEGQIMMGEVMVYPNLKKKLYEFQLIDYLVTSATGYEYWIVRFGGVFNAPFEERVWLRPIIGGEPNKCTITAYVVDKPIVELVKY